MAELTAQWALWGKQGTDRAYRVLACSAGDLTARDFEVAVGRYAAGSADRLPQHMIFWLPDQAGEVAFAGLAIHEHASYAQADSRSRYDGSGREIVFIRLFCVRYADLAEHRVACTELLDAVRQQQLPPRDPAAPLTLSVTRQQRPPAGAAPELAGLVAAMLLTTRPVCVLGADQVSADERLAFIDEVLALLPYGLRATLSASTWASPTAHDLKLRLFFTSARGDSGRTHHVRWDQRAPDADPAPENVAVRQYLDWLRGAGTHARSWLMTQTAPRPFTGAAIHELVSALPTDPKVADTLEELAASLINRDTAAAKAEVERLERRLADPVHPTDRKHYRDQVVRHRLLAAHPGLNPSAKARIYRALLRLAFEAPLSYASYCEIEDSAGGPPHGTLRSVLLRELSFGGCAPWLLTAKAEPRVSDEELMTALTERGVPATDPLDELRRDVATLRHAHRAAFYDFALRYLRSYAKAPAAELVRRGYLADTLEAVFPREPQAQHTRLEETLRFTHAESLSRAQIRDLFGQRDLQPTAAFEAAVASLASPKSAQLIREQAAYARGRQQGDDGEPAEPGTEPEAGPWQRFARRLGLG